MIELVFVIAILGIVSAVAIPRLTATKTDAEIAKGRAEIASIRTAIITERQSRLLRGESAFIAGDAIDTADGLFGALLRYPLQDSSKSGHWSHSATADANSSRYTFHLKNIGIDFTYTRSNGIFTCSKTAGTPQQKIYCGNLID